MSLCHYVENNRSSTRGLKLRAHRPFWARNLTHIWPMTRCQSWCNLATVGLGLRPLIDTHTVPDLCWGLHRWETPGHCSWLPCRTEDEAESQTWSPGWAWRGDWWCFSGMIGLQRRKHQEWIDRMECVKLTKSNGGSAVVHSCCGLLSISRSMVERHSLCPSLVASSFCFRLLPTLSRRPTVVTCW